MHCGVAAKLGPDPNFSVVVDAASEGLGGASRFLGGDAALAGGAAGTRRLAGHGRDGNLLQHRAELGDAVFVLLTFWPPGPLLRT
jgi:hypothetical protein